MSQEKQIFNQTLTLENRKRIMLTGVNEVVSQIDKAVVLKSAGVLATISGQELRVVKLNLEEGVLIVEGKIDGFKYADNNQSKGFFKRIFK